MRWTILLALMISTATASEGGLLTGATKARVIYGRLDRDFADQTASVLRVSEALIRSGIAVLPENTGEADIVVVLNLECTPAASDALPDAVICQISLEVFAQGRTGYGGAGMVTIYRHAGKPQVAGALGVRGSALAKGYEALARKLADEIAAQNSR